MMQGHFPEPYGVGGRRIPLAELRINIAREVSELARICARIETALGGCFDENPDPGALDIVTSQGLDRIRQSLEALAGLEKTPATGVDGSGGFLFEQDIYAAVFLGSLAQRLCNSTPVVPDTAGTPEFFKPAR
jgi:hypothetical protein